MLTILTIIWIIVFISLILLAVGLGFADACGEVAGEESIYSELEDF